jgi:hypothetical protein
LVPVFQSAVAGLFSQVASTASKEEGRRNKEEVRRKNEARSFLPERMEQGKPELTAECGTSVCKLTAHNQKLFPLWQALLKKEGSTLNEKRRSKRAADSKQRRAF